MSQLVDFDSFCRVLADELNLPSIAEAELLDCDVLLDSLLRFEMLLVVEDWAGVMLPEALIPTLQTLRDFYDIYCTRASQHDPARVGRR